MTRFLITDPGAAHSAKNATAPGLSHQPRQDRNGEAPMVSQTLIHQAPQRTGYRCELVATVLTVIVGRHAAGHSLDDIVTFLRGTLGPENRTTCRNFVQWVITTAGGEGR